MSAIYQAIYRKTEKGLTTQHKYYRSEAKKENNRRWREKNKEKIKAHKILNRAINKGWLLRKPCIACGQENAHGHHFDYNKPLEIIWLCKIHHGQLHNGGLKPQLGGDVYVFRFDGEDEETTDGDVEATNGDEPEAVAA